MTECEICCYKYTLSKRKKITCPSCEFDCCLQCFRTYILDHASNPSCMNCKIDYTTDYICKHTPQSFFEKELSEAITDLEVMKEKTMLPATQPMVENIIKAEKLDLVVQETYNEEREIRKKLHDVMRKRHDIWAQQHELRNSQKKKKRSSVFVKKCSVENCRGFLSQSWKCGICETYTCKDCNRPKNGRDDPNHVCNPDDVATMKLLEKDTKNCPKCAVPIHKIDGCSQMYCVECHTAFCWNTGKIVTGVIHNPHFYEYQRQVLNNGGNIERNNAVCNNGLPWLEFVENACIAKDQYFSDAIVDTHRLIGHIRDICIPYYRRRDEMDNTDIRIAYLRQLITEKEFRQTVKKRIKKVKKATEISMILEMFTDTMADIFNNFVSHRGGDFVLEEMMDNLRSYANNQLTVVKKRYKNQVPVIELDWRISW